MTDLEKVIKGLKACEGTGCIDCVYYEEEEPCKLNEDALLLITAQEEKIRSLEQTIEDICCGGAVK